MLNTKQMTLLEVANFLDAKLVGDGEKSITGLSTLEAGSEGTVTFLTNPLYKKFVANTSATAVLLDQATFDSLVEEGAASCDFLILKNPYLGYAQLSKLFDRAYDFTPGVHPSATVSEGVDVPATAYVGPNAVIEANVILEEGIYVGANTVVGAGSKLSHGARLWANVTLYSNVSIGKRSIVHSGTVIGSDGFGNAQDNGQWVKIAQLGGVTIGDDVEIGSNTSIDRGALEDTIIENGVRIDNLVQVAHNVRVGENTALAGCVGVAGSTVIGKNCIIGGGTGLAGHIEIADQVAMTGMTMVTKSIKKPGLYSSGTGVEQNNVWRRMVARMRNIDTLFKRVKEIEKKLDSGQ